MTENKKINVLIVDDSALMRVMLSDALKTHSSINVVGVAENGIKALKEIERLKPDIITMDVEMPGMNGLETLVEISKTRPTPVIMLSSLTKAGAETTIKALELGAVDFVTKPDVSKGQTLDQVKYELIAKIIAICGVPQVNPQTVIQHKSIEVPVQRHFGKTDNIKTVLIGSSTGGPQALKEVIPLLKKDLPAQYIIVQHMPPTFTGMLAQRINRISQIEVREAKEGDVMKMGVALMAPGGYHMTVEEGGILKFNQDPLLWGVRPAVDITLKSAAKLYKEDLICVILTGMGKDGTEGAGTAKKYGGYCIAQDKSTCIIYGMPKCVIEAGYADKILPVHGIADAIAEAVYK